MNIINYFGLISTIIFVNLFSPASINQKPIENRANTKLQKIEYLKQPIKVSSNSFAASASSALSYDINSSIMLYEKNIDQKRSIASINKLMTVLVIMQNHNPNEVVKVGKLPELGPYDQKIGITEGEEFELPELVKASLIQSANDAANALAIYDSGSIEKFVEKMNKQAKELGLSNSKFANPTGLEGGDDYSTARDVLTLGLTLFNNKFFQNVVATDAQYITNLSGKKYLITTTNKLLGKYGVIGMKTGYTLKSRECLIAVTSRNENKVITVVLDSPNRFQESKSMIDWSFSNYIWQ